MRPMNKITKLDQLQMFTLLCCTLLLVPHTLADEKERLGGGINFEFRKKLCKPGAIRKSYNLANRRLASNVTLVSARWVAANPFEIEYSGRKYKWPRKKPAGVCEEVFRISDSRSSKDIGKRIKVFHDGCSGEWKRKAVPDNSMKAKTWGQFFHASCVRHDHCYHHESSSNGRDQKKCDDIMLEGNRGLCKVEFASGSSDRSTCMKAAEKQYAGVRLFKRGKYYDQMDVAQDYRALYERK